MITSTLAASRPVSADDDPRDVVAHAAPDEISQKVLWALQHAALAPSLEHGQPWVFRWLPEQSVVEVYADLRRHAGGADQRSRQVHLSCGAALECLVIALRAAGLAAAVAMGTGEAGEPVAAISYTPAAEVAEADIELARAVGVRRTAHSAFADQLISTTLVGTLASAGREHGVEVHLAQRPKGPAFVAPWTQVPDGAEIGDSEILRELAASSRPTRIVGGGAGSSAFSHSTAPTASRPDSSSVTLAVLSTAGDTQADWVAAGRTLASVLLTAATHGVQASYLNAGVQLTEVRPQLCDELGIDATPQLVLRLGHATAPTRPASTRPPLSTILATTRPLIPRPRSASS